MLLAAIGLSINKGLLFITLCEDTVLSDWSSVIDKCISHVIVTHSVTCEERCSLDKNEIYKSCVHRLGV